MRHKVMDKGGSEIRTDELGEPVAVISGPT
jgi:hypothetical protein